MNSIIDQFNILKQDIALYWNIHHKLNEEFKLFLQSLLKISTLLHNNPSHLLIKSLKIKNSKVDNNKQSIANRSINWKDYLVKDPVWIQKDPVTELIGHRSGIEVE